jgi:hypothetical protein
MAEVIDDDEEQSVHSVGFPMAQRALLAMRN